MSTISLITGSSRGLGRNAAIHIARKGGDVIVTYQTREGDALDVVAEINAMGRKAVALQLDTGKVSEFPPFVERLKATLSELWHRDTFDHLINNAGHGELASIEETTEEQFDSLINVHFKGVFFFTQAMLPLLADGGHIINLSSGLTRFVYPGFAVYASAKKAVELFSVYLAKELGGRRIRVNTVAPGAIETDFLGGAVRDTPDFKQQITDVTALGRVGQPDDIGPMIASLLSEDNRWVNAQRIEVSGGQDI